MVSFVRGAGVLQCDLVLLFLPSRTTETSNKIFEKSGDQLRVVGPRCIFGCRVSVCTLFNSLGIRLPIRDSSSVHIPFNMSLTSSTS